MCGISGIVNKKDQEVDRDILKNMNDSIEHRGPDGEGMFFGKNFAFGHRRLSIIDLSNAGHQPMQYRHLTITYNGEIYNYIEIRSELIELGYNFKSESDTEVILASYLEWGSTCVERFNGMWAFVIFDEKKNELFCSRDRFGIKPFYYLETDDQFIFGSEIKQILPFLKKVSINERVLLDYLITGLEECDDECFFSSIKKLPGSYNLIYNLIDHSFKQERYYSITTNKELDKLPEKEASETYLKALIKATRLRMRSDVKVGTCLSGGLDSSTIAAISSEIYNEDSNEKFNGIHAKSSEKASDESMYAKQVSEHCNLNLNTIQPTKEEFKDLIDEVVYTQEEPFGSPSIFMQYLVMKKARAENCIVLLDGQGGDETLLGYEKYYPAYIKSINGLAKIKAWRQSAENSKLSKVDVFKFYFYFTRYNLRLKRLKRRFRFIKAHHLQKFQSSALKNLSENYANLLDLQKTEIESTQLPHLLKYEDKNSMRNSIETRLPFIDYEVLETALSINNKLKIKNGWSKHILRKAIEKKLPESVVWRKNKLGFNAPEKTWLDEIESDMEDTIQQSKLLNNYIDFDNLTFKSLNLRTKWRLFNIAKWEQIYHVNLD